jgi:chloramphenicol-sensitive protein RarD
MGPAVDSNSARTHARAGVLYGVAAYLFWGLVPLYFKHLVTIPAPEVLAHRAVWSLAFLAAVLAVASGLPALRRALAHRRTLALLLATTVLVGSNWLLFIYSVQTARVVEASLGYFMTPLVNVLLGVVVLRERLTKWQALSVALAAAGVAAMTFSYGRAPWLAIGLAGTFGLYGLLRKVAAVEALVGLTIETILMFPVAAAYLAWVASRGGSSFGTVSRSTDVLLALSGVVTALPLLWFAAAARRLRLSTMGLLQYIAPSIQLVIAVAGFGEPFGRAQAFAFACIWAALAVYSVDALARARRVAPLPA